MADNHGVVRAKRPTMATLLRGVTIACVLFGAVCAVIALIVPQPDGGGQEVWLGIGEFLVGIGLLVVLGGNGLLLVRAPAQASLPFRQEAERTGHPALYGLALIWCGLILGGLSWANGFYLLTHREIPGFSGANHLSLWIGLAVVLAFLPSVGLLLVGWIRSRHRRDG